MLVEIINTKRCEDSWYSNMVGEIVEGEIKGEVFLVNSFTEKQKGMILGGYDEGRLYSTICGYGIWYPEDCLRRTFRVMMLEKLRGNNG